MKPGSMCVQDHLGGFVIGGDPATYYPDLWKWLVHNLGVRSVVDVGCGEGHALKTFRTLGCSVLGVDGVKQADPDIVVHDYTLGPFTNGWTFDLAWSCEFVEHVEEQYVPNFLATFKRAKIVLMTHAEPGQAGYHHVNCRSSDYWQGAMAAAGFRLDIQLSDQTRQVSRLNTNPWNHYARCGLAFRSTDPNGILG